MIVKLVCWLLSLKTLNASQRTLLTNQIIKSIDALPLHAIITTGEGKLFIRGTQLDSEKALVIRASADQALHNAALEFVHEQVLYEAVTLGIHQGTDLLQIQFAKAAIWYSQQEIKLLKTLSTGTTELLG